MVRSFVIRMAGALGIVALALLLVGLVPFLGVSYTAGAGVGSSAPAFLVNRDGKSERLSVMAPAKAYAPDWNAEFSALPQAQPAPRAQMPLGCDPAFSPITSPVRYNVFGRCMA
jgi:hypothetical protein